MTTVKCPLLQSPLHKIGSDGELINLWLGFSSTNAVSSKHYLKKLRAFLAFLSTKPIASITNQDIKSYHEHLIRKGSAHNTIVTNLSVIRSFVRFAMCNGYLAADLSCFPKDLRTREAAQERILTCSELQT